jgi:hypothetical protein
MLCLSHQLPQKSKQGKVVMNYRSTVHFSHLQPMLSEEGILLSHKQYKELKLRPLFQTPASSLNMAESSRALEVLVQPLLRHQPQQLRQAPSIRTT